MTQPSSAPVLYRLSPHTVPRLPRPTCVPLQELLLPRRGHLQDVQSVPQLVIRSAQSLHLLLCNVNIIILMVMQNIYDIINI